MRYITFLLLVICFACGGQHASPPDYLTTQNFPDSVQSLGVQTLDGTGLTFGEVLNKYKGKKVVVDIWASWCRDCIVGYPKLEALRKEVGEQNVAYVFLSVDKEIPKWKHTIDRFQIRGDHYLLDGAWNNPLSNYIDLDWVPRYLVLDENGKIIMPKAVHADDEKLKKALEGNRR